MDTVPSCGSTFVPWLSISRERMAELVRSPQPWAWSRPISTCWITGLSSGVPLPSFAPTASTVVISRNRRLMEPFCPWSLAFLFTVNHSTAFS